MICNYKSTLIICIVLLGLSPKMGQACTTFCYDYENQLLFGKNFDWIVGDGLVIINKRGVIKTAESEGPKIQEKPLIWTSKYGSATFNQHGREFPLGGMNEAGLVVETMMLDKTEYPLSDSRAEIDVFRWIQYQLDNFSTVEEVIASNSQLRIKRSKGFGFHFLICDRTGNCTIIEFIKSKLVDFTKERMPVNVLTNSSYAESVSFWRESKVPQPDKSQSIERFIRVANVISNDAPKTTKNPINYSFSILNSAEHVSFPTQWSIVYDISNLSVYFRTLEKRALRHFSFKNFDFSCASPVKMLDVDDDLSGDIADRFVDYSFQINRNLIRYVYFKTYFSNLSGDTLDVLSRYPETTTCSE